MVSSAQIVYWSELHFYFLTYIILFQPTTKQLIPNTTEQYSFEVHLSNQSLFSLHKRNQENIIMFFVSLFIHRRATDIP